jgi:D-3-phosphoglycerate dehydrogenase / 2-oxoglutarate reductase
MSGPVIFSTHPLHPQVTTALTAIGPYRIANAPTPQAIVEESGGAEIIVVRAPIPPAAIAQATGLRALVRHGAGLDMIPVETASEHGVLVANIPGANAVTVAEHVIWTALALLRCYPQVDRDLRGQGWNAGRAYSDHGREISGRTLGVLGMGSIGQALARIGGQGFGMPVLCHTRRPESVPAGVQPVPFDQLLQDADILVLCVPLTDQTRGLIDKAALARMKPGAILVNVARGPVVHERALIEALQSGHLAGAAIDVFDTQPLPPDHAFLTLPNVLLTPHMAGITQESMLRIGLGVVAEIQRIAAGALPVNLVNAGAVPLYRRRFGG